MLPSSLDTLLNVSKNTSPQKLFDYDCVTLYRFKPYIIFAEWKESTLTRMVTVELRCREIIEFLLYRGFPRLIWPKILIFKWKILEII